MATCAAVDAGTPAEVGVSETPDDDVASASEVTQKARQQHAAVKLVLGLLWRSGQQWRVVGRIAGSVDWATYCAEIDALRADVRTKYLAAVERGEIEHVEPAPDLDAALLVALHYFHAKEAPPLPLPAGALQSTGDLMRYFAQQAMAGRWSLAPT